MRDSECVEWLSTELYMLKNHKVNDTNEIKLGLIGKGLNHHRPSSTGNIELRGTKKKFNRISKPKIQCCDKRESECVCKMRRK